MSKISKFLHSFFFLTILVLASCGADFNKNKKPLPVESPLTAQCSCAMTYEPICGSNGVTYDNVCIAGCFNATQVKQGSCTCSPTKDVCGDDGVTYKECDAQDLIAKGMLTKITSFADCSVTPH
jgi:hypothetical protein